MSAFEYTALEKTGRTRQGVLEGDTPRQVRQQLREQGLTPLSIETVVKSTSQRRRRYFRVSATELALLTRQLATLVRSSLALEEALRAMAEQSETARLKSLLLAVRGRVLEGHSLADSLNDFPSIFSELYRATIAAGEQSGHLEVVLERLADYTETRQYMRQKTLVALFYPALLSAVALLVVMGLLTYVVPQVVQVFANLHQKLPWLTVALINFSDFLKTWGGLLLLGLIGLVAGLRYLLRFEKPLILFHRLLLHTPILSRLIRGAEVARFTRTLSILLTSGVALLEALRMSVQVISSRPLQQAVTQATAKVREGSSLHDALAPSKLFPPMTIYLIASGETSGNLEGMLERAAIMQERELETLLAVLLGLFEPLLILLMGGIVLTIVLAILMPIFELNQLVR